MNTISTTGRVEPQPIEKDPMAPEMTKEEITIAVEEAHRCGLKVAAHGQGGIGVTWAIEAGVDSIEHGKFMTDEQMELLVSHKTYLVFTFGTTQLLAYSGLYPESTKKRALRVASGLKDWMARTRDAGVRVALGCDVYHGMILTEIQAMVTGGYTPMEAIVAATSAGAELCGIADVVGTLEAGKVADLVAVSGDPMHDIKPVTWGPDAPYDAGIKVEAVMKSGQLVRS